MTKDEFKTSVKEALSEYIDNSTSFDSDPQLKVIPADMSVWIENGGDMASEIEDSDEAVEAAAAAEGALAEEADDFQASRNPDFFPVKSLLRHVGPLTRIDGRAVNKIVARYFR